MRIPGSPTGGPFGANKLVYHDEFLATEIGQTGTQFDGLGHIGIQMGKDGDKNEMRYYNGVTEQEIGDAYGLKKIGIEHVKPFFTRGHLFDVEAVKGDMMEAGQEITVADLRAALQKQNMQEADIKEGDAVFFNTGWGKLWMKNNDKFNGGEPGIGLEVAKWCVDKGVCLTGADHGRPRSCPIPNKDLAFAVHGELITKNGIFNHENLDFTALIADRKYQFAYIFSPAPIKGATGSNGGPIAGDLTARRLAPRNALAQAGAFCFDGAKKSGGKTMSMFRTAAAAALVLGMALPRRRRRAFPRPSRRRRSASCRRASSG